MTVRLLSIMGSGETAPTLARVHREMIARLGPGPVPAVLVDTPYGFQENADDISGRTVDYFRENIGNPISVASFRSAADGPVERSTAVARIRAARYVFTGPGSPSYALRTWQGSEFPTLFAEKLAAGGALTFASAAALTLGVVTVPVYEIYKVGEDPHWLPGLDLLGPLGLHVAVIPHYDNAEGGNHDTRFCYLGERRLQILEAALPEDVAILGIDGHTALILDLDEGGASVVGNGGVTVRLAGRSTIVPAGARIGLDELIGLTHGGPDDGAFPSGVNAAPVRGSRDRSDRDGEREIDGAGAAVGRGVARNGETVLEERTLASLVRESERAFDDGVAARDAGAAVRAILELDAAVVDWSRDPGRADEYAHARAVLRSLIVRLGDLAVGGVRDPRDQIAPFVEALLELRLRAREARDWASADLIRDRLTTIGIEVRDGAAGTGWELRDLLVSPTGRSIPATSED